MAFSIARLVCTHVNGYNKIYEYVTDGSDVAPALTTAGFFNTAKTTYGILGVGDIIIAGVSTNGSVSNFVVTIANSTTGVSLNGTW